MQMVFDIKKFFLFIVFCSLLSCAVQKEPSSEKLLIEYKTTDCLGECPVFQLRIYSNGKSFYAGIENVEKKGNFYRRISKSHLAELNQIFEQEKFLTFNGIYDSQYSDLPTAQIIWNIDGNRKTVSCTGGAPDGFENIEGHLLKFIDHDSWKELR